MRGIVVILSLVIATFDVGAASLETLIMPGPVIAGHEEFESECENCHVPFDPESQRGLCLDCHERIAEDLELGTGFHALNPESRDETCRSCHTDHNGRDADIVGLVAELFDHSLTDFPLQGAHEDRSCAECHRVETAYFEASNECVGCHDADDIHRGNLGDGCDDCHEQTSWADAEFDHSDTDFELTGKHAITACASCHIDQSYEDTSQLCVDCHRVDDVHGDERSDACGDCHGTERWADAEFDHQRETDFALTGAHETLACAGCHLPDMSFMSPPTDCAGCHSEDDSHLGRNGSECDQCHVDSDWSVAYHHHAETGFALTGAHATTACTSCHVGRLIDPLPTTCAECHASDDPHEGSQPDCAACHGAGGASSWVQDLTFHHDLTAFPLIGLHGVAACEQCHASLVFAGTSAACTDCHLDDDVHESSLGTECAACHNPVGWAFWKFDHDTQTEYPLTGAHEDLACAGCHRVGVAALPGTRCVRCHVEDDIHDGSFGSNCDQCHATDTFAEPLFDR